MPARRPEPATRRRGEVLARAIREATLAELAEGSYTDVTFESVARRARTSKPVLYRRYASRAQMVADALLGELRAQRDTVTGSTGSLCGDLHRLFELVLEPSRVAGPRALRALIGDADDELYARIASVDKGPAIDTLIRVVEAARKRGELGANPIPEPALMAPVGLLRAEVIQREVPSDYLDHVIDTVALPLYRLWSGGGSDVVLERGA